MNFGNKLRIDYQKLLGPHLACYIGQTVNEKIRERASSGGCLTSLLIEILENRLVEGIIGVGWNEEKLWPPELKRLNTKQEIIKAAGSKYLRIPIADTLDLIKKNDNKGLAVVGHPCTIAAIRNFKNRNKLANVKFLIGFFCGWCMSWQATEYLLKKLKIKKDKIKKIDYRGGKYPGGFRVELKDGSFKQLPKSFYDYLNLAFLAPGCANCHFYTNEAADISFGDFWHKDYQKYGAIIVRTEAGKQLFNLIKDKIKFEKIDPQRIIKSHWHNLSHKKLKPHRFKTVMMKILNNDLAPKLIPFNLILFLTSLRRKIILWQKNLFGKE